jgi:ankyrin repeat protein
MRGRLVVQRSPMLPEGRNPDGPSWGLLERHADPNAERRSPRKHEAGRLPELATRLCETCLDAVKSSSYVEPPAPEALPWSTALAAALANRHYEIARLLLDHGAAVDQRAANLGDDSSHKHGWAGPALVLFSDDIEAVTLLVEHGADVNGRDRDGDTALLLACGAETGTRPGPQVVQALLAHGADANAKGAHETTPLMAAARHGRLDVVRLLLEAHANVNAADANRVTALQWAINSGSSEIAALLRARGAR